MLLLLAPAAHVPDNPKYFFTSAEPPLVTLHCLLFPQIMVIVEPEGGLLAKKGAFD